MLPWDLIHKSILLGSFYSLLFQSIYSCSTSHRVVNKIISPVSLNFLLPTPFSMKRLWEKNYLSVAKLFPIHIFISTPVLWPAGQQAVNSCKLAIQKLNFNEQIIFSSEYISVSSVKSAHSSQSCRKCVCVCTPGGVHMPLGFFLYISLEKPKMETLLFY